MPCLKRIVSTGCVVLMSVGVGGSIASAAVDSDRIAAPVWGPDVYGGYASTHIIVQLEPGIEPGRLGDGRLTLLGVGEQQHQPPGLRGPAGAGTATGQAADLITAALQRWKAELITPALTTQPANRQLAAQIGLDRYYKIHVPPGTDTPAMAAQFAGFVTHIGSAEVDGIGGIAQTIPNDNDFDLQYALLNTGQTGGIPDADIDATDAWDETTGSAALLLAVLDAGMDEHVEFAGRLVDGWNTASNNGDTSDSCGSHGTHVGGIAAATGNNTIGIAGVNWAVWVMPVRVLNGCNGTESPLADGIIYATDHGADVINMSLQFADGTNYLHDAVTYGYMSGVVLVAAAGNFGFSGGVAFPARWDETIAVAATDNQDQRWSGSNQGPQLTVAAPGVNVWSLFGSANYAYMTGTSMATPHVSGLATLMLSLDGSLTPDEVRDILQATADDVDAPGFDNNTGFGRINANAALLEVLAGISIPGDLDGDGAVGILDLLILLTAWGPCPDPPEECPADLALDGSVGVLDLLTLLAYWG
ncbi:MAG: S8 family serine peptidase [Planctomycetota bacterium]|nr:S8 family serine peptidase [Planctomycetota bacterium]